MTSTISDEQVQADPVDLSCPERIWLQVDTDGEDRSAPVPKEDWTDLSWCWHRIGGVEVEYVRTDLATRAPDPRVVELIAVAKKAERALRAYGMAMIQCSPLPVDLGPYFKDADELRAAIAAMENGNG